MNRHDPGARLTRAERHRNAAEGLYERAEEHYQTLEDQWAERHSHEDITAREYHRLLRLEQRGMGVLGQAHRTLSRARKLLRAWKLLTKQAGRRYYDDRGVGVGG